MRYKKEQLAEIQKVDLLTYLREKEPHELVSLGRDLYTTRTHGSLKISWGLWMWWSRGIGGRSALDYLIKVRDIPFKDAVEMIAGTTFSYEEVPVTKQKKEKKGFALPKKSEVFFHARDYLLGRGIDEGIIDALYQEGLIYENTKYESVIFVGKDGKGIPRYAAFRSTSGERKLGEVGGSDKHFSFRLMGTNKDTMHLFEGAVDVLSYATIRKECGYDWREDMLISLGGIHVPKVEGEPIKMPKALEQALKELPESKKVVLHLDNDEAGKRAAAAIKKLLEERVEVIDDPSPCGKDVNDFLLFMGEQKEKERSRER